MDSEIIPSGFEINPLDSGLSKSDLLCRYLSMEKFRKLLEGESLWFTRIFNWKRDDPCEAILLPVFRNELIRTHGRNKEAIDWMVGDLELGLKSSFGCCFLKHDGNEKSHMWQIYCPRGEGFGVMIQLKPESIMEAIHRATFQVKYLKSVNYITDSCANSMTLKETKHSYHPHNPSYFNAYESLFYKRKAYESEGEVRAVLSHGTFRSSYLLWFARENGIPIAEYDSAALRPESIPENIMRLAASGENSKRFMIDFNSIMTSRLTKAIEEDFESTFPMLKNEKGVNIKIVLKDIERIVIHPSICKNVKDRNALLELVESYELGDKLVESELAKSKWY